MISWGYDLTKVQGDAFVVQLECSHFEHSGNDLSVTRSAHLGIGIMHINIATHNNSPTAQKSYKLFHNTSEAGKDCHPALSGLLHLFTGRSVGPCRVIHKQPLRG